MKMQKFIAASCCLMAASLVSCGGGAPVAGSALGAMTETQPHAAGGRSKQDLIYVANGNNEVTVYSYSSQQLVGVLTQFTKPEGECVDGEGNVYITDASANRILEFAHGGAKPIKTYDDSPDSPYACAIDPVSGNLAVANDDGSSGNIAIWSKSSGQRTTYSDSALGVFQGCAYDSNGNLLVTNGYLGYANPSLFAWLPEGGTRLTNVKVPGPNGSRTWHYILGIQWDGKFFVLDDGQTIYRVLLIHGQAYYVGDTELYYGSGQFGFYSSKKGFQATVVVGPGDSESSSSVYYWNYPAGGQPVTEISHGVDWPVAVVVSLAAK
ncbi:MAG TPA: hypothetical protein VGG51_03470 [Candidatus Cybelea sp.]|jgi:DNA-binding beta-propeller fold protein YncE